MIPQQPMIAIGLVIPLAKKLSIKSKPSRRATSKITECQLAIFQAILIVSGERGKETLLSVLIMPLRQA
jgi:hypothetical protein